MDASRFTWQEYLAKIPPYLLTHAQTRRILTRDSPLLFALIYFPKSLASKETGRAISFSQFHLDLAESAKQWARPDLQPHEIREAWVAPRGSGKSTWLFGPGVLTTWALAHGHRRFIAAYTGKASLARDHLASFRANLENNRLLRSDFPELCTPATTMYGKTKANTQDAYQAKSGVVFKAFGMNTQNLGTKVEDQRPDLILFDDIENDEGNYSAYQKEQRLKTVTQAVLPQNPNAVVQFAGTTTMYGSMMHDLVNSVRTIETADWVADAGIKVRYYPALQIQDDGTERSLWPQRWSLEYLQSIRHTRDFAMNYMNEPMSLDGDFWEPKDFLHLAPTSVMERVLVVDPMVSHKTQGTDYHGLAVVGFDRTDGRVAVDLVEQMKGASAKLKQRIWQILEMDPTIRSMLIEVNQGVDLWKDILLPLPMGVDMISVHNHQNKLVRAAQVHNWYQMGLVGHTRKHPQFEAQAMSMPNGVNDDMVDAVVMGVSYWLSRRTNPKASVTSGSYI